MASEALQQWSGHGCQDDVCSTPASDQRYHTTSRSASPPFISSSSSSPSETSSPRNSFPFPSPSPCRPLTPVFHSVIVTPDQNAVAHTSDEQEGDETHTNTPTKMVVERNSISLPPSSSPPPLCLPPRCDFLLFRSDTTAHTTSLPLVSLRQRRRRTRQQRRELQQWSFQPRSSKGSLPSFSSPLSLSCNREVSASASPFLLDANVLEEEQTRVVNDVLEEMEVEKKKRFLNWWRAWHQREGTIERSATASFSQPPLRPSIHATTATTAMVQPRNQRYKKKGKASRKQHAPTALSGTSSCTTGGCRPRIFTTHVHGTPPEEKKTKNILSHSTTTTIASHIAPLWAFFVNVVFPPVSFCMQYLGWVWSFFYRYVWLFLFPMENAEGDRVVNELLEEDESPPLELTMLAFSVGERIWRRFSAMRGEDRS